MANQQSTLLTGEEIKSEKLVTDGADTVSYTHLTLPTICSV